MKLSLFIAKRYLFSKKKQNAINIISVISVDDSLDYIDKIDELLK